MKGCGGKIGPFDCCTVILGKCEKYLPQIPKGAIDIVLTDPPYGKGLQSWREENGPIQGDDHFPVETIKRLIKIPRLAPYLFCQWDNLWDHETLPKPKSVLVWEKIETGGTGDTKHEHSRDYEMVLFYPRLPAHKFKGRPSDVIAASRTLNLVHPTMKPVRLLRDMLAWYDFKTVLDPYMGSGSTGQAAKAMGKHFLGFEADKKHHSTAVYNIAEEPSPSEQKRFSSRLAQPPLDLY
jgi:DNA modification methylase